MGSPDDLGRCMMYTAVGGSQLSAGIQYKTWWRLSVREDKQFVLFQSP
jgi:hypothetical protein